MVAQPEWFAGRLRELREALNWTREVLAERSGIPVPTLRDLESGKYSPGWPSVLTLAATLGVGVEAFTQEPAPREAPKMGRPKQVPLEPPARPDQTPPKRGRPRKVEPTEEIEAVKGTAPITKKGA